MSRVVLKTQTGAPAFLDEKDAAAFEEGQKRLQNGEQPANAQQRTSEILSLLRKMAKK